MMVLSACQIDLARNGFQMRWIDAAANTTKMIDIKTFWDRPAQKSIRKTMGIGPFIYYPFPLKPVSL